MNRFLFFLMITVTFHIANQAYSQNPDIEGMWLVCNAKDDCDDSESGVYMLFEKKTMQTYVQVTGLDPQPVGEKLKYVWEESVMVVSKKGDPMRDRYLIEVKDDEMVMTHKTSGSKNYFVRR